MSPSPYSPAGQGREAAWLGSPSSERHCVGGLRGLGPGFLLRRGTETHAQLWEAKTGLGKRIEEGRWRASLMGAGRKTSPSSEADGEEAVKEHLGFIT